MSVQTDDPQKMFKNGHYREKACTDIEAYCHIPPSFHCSRGKSQHPLLLLPTSVRKDRRLRTHSTRIIVLMVKISSSGRWH